MQKLMEQVILSNRSRFGRSSEKIDDPCQLRFMEVDGNIIFFNETEAQANIEAPEPEEIEVSKRGKKETGKREKGSEEYSNCAS